MSQTKLTIPQPTMAKDDLPVYRAMRHGVGALSDSELISMMLPGKPEETIKTARSILMQSDNDLHTLAKRSSQELCQIPNVGQSGAMTVLACMELSRRRWSRDTIKKQEVKSSAEAYNIIMPLIIDKHVEEFWAIYLNQACKVLKVEIAGTGGVSHVPVDLKTILKAAILNGATQIILAHNHPSGRTTASASDIALTDRIVEAAKLMDLRVIDHIIVGENGYFSFADENMI